MNRENPVTVEDDVAQQNFFRAIINGKLSVGVLCGSVTNG